MKRSGIRPRRATPRQRVAPRWSPEEWDEANTVLGLRSLGRCEACGDPLNGRAERHHRQRRRDGGDRLSNIALLSPECHAWVTTHPAEARERGLIVSAHAPDPAAVPMLWQGFRWVLLRDDGGLSPAPPNSSEESLDRSG